MDRAEAYKLAQDELNSIELAGYEVALGYIDNSVQKNVSAVSGTVYDIELSYRWKDRAKEQIRASCSVTSKSWFQHQQLEESITLCRRAI